MSDIERESFEKEFPVPKNVTWCGRGYASTDWGTGDNYKNSYDYMWMAWQAARQSPTSGEPVAWACFGNSSLTTHFAVGSDAHEAERKMEALNFYSYKTVPLYTHPPAKVPERHLRALRTAMHHWMKDGVHSDDEEDATFCDEVLQELLTTTPETEWVIQLRGDYLATRGIWERPDHRGYTNELHEAGRYSEDEAKKAQEMAPDKYKAVCLSATTPQLADKWIRLSDSEPDFDEAGNAWLCRWVEHLEAWEVDLKTYNDVFEGISRRVREVFVGAYWMPTGLKRPQPPREQGGE